MSKSDLEASKGRFEAMMDMARVEELSLDSLGMVEESLAASHIQTLCRQVIVSWDGRRIACSFSYTNAVQASNSVTDQRDRGAGTCGG
jgi:hypothetical protein